ncbi:MAG: cold shock domain-containing protein CspD [Pseudomonadales bacterium]|jgi:CspA family cold shock protein|nr:cold shock domain-containing protein CspD [Pseudomonadales bacterium]
MKTGTVKWFNNAKGYGFILPEEGGEDLFVHYSSIQMDGYRTLKAGQAVQYDTQEGEKGSHAVNVCAERPERALQDAGTTADAPEGTTAREGMALASGYAEDFQGD